MWHRLSLKELFNQDPMDKNKGLGLNGKNLKEHPMVCLDVF